MAMSTVDADVEKRKAAVLAKLTVGLPAMPSHRVHLTALLAVNPVDLKKVAALIRSDRKLEERLLSLADSESFGAQRRAGKTEAAAILIGPQRLRTLLFTDYLLAVSGGRLGERRMQEFWLQSLGTAMLSERLALAVGYERPERCYYAGILHDAGKLPLLLALREAIDARSPEFEDDDERLLQKERERFGFDHCQAGRWLALHWRLDLAMLEVLGLHHQPATARHDTALVGIVAAGDRLCRKAEAGLPLAAVDKFYHQCLPWLSRKGVEQVIALLAREYPLWRAQLEFPAGLACPAPARKSATGTRGKPNRTRQHAQPAQ